MPKRDLPEGTSSKARKARVEEDMPPSLDAKVSKALDRAMSSVSSKAQAATASPASSTTPKDRMAPSEKGGERKIAPIDIERQMKASETIEQAVPPQSELGELDEPGESDP